ncbi:GNAT family N-acetyltransferase [Nocardioides sp. P5_C9_2]
MDDLTPVRFRDGTDGFVVPLVAANREALRQEYEHLSLRTRSGRFLAAVPTLTQTMLDHLVDDVDGVDHVALVAMITAEDGTEVPVGLARIIRYADDASAADLGVTVVDEWQGRGVATALLEILMTQRPDGVERIRTVTRADNLASLAMLRALGDVEVDLAGPGVLAVVVHLDPGRGTDGSRPSTTPTTPPVR